MAKLRTTLACLFLLLQLALVIYARFDPHRRFCWAPNDAVTTYHFQVKVGGRELTLPEVAARYHFASNRRWKFEDVPADVIAIVRQYEETYGRDDRATVVMTYTINGNAEVHQWQWPQE